MKGIDEDHHTDSNQDGVDVDHRSSCASSDDGLVFTNLVETDMVWGHRRDPEGFHRCLREFDRRIPEIRGGAAAPATCSSSPPTTAATRPTAGPTTRASSCRSSRTSPGHAEHRGAARTAATSATSARASAPGSACPRPASCPACSFVDVERDRPMTPPRTQRAGRSGRPRPERSTWSARSAPSATAASSTTRRSTRSSTGYVGGSIPDYQMSALLMAICFRGLDAAPRRCA